MISHVIAKIAINAKIATIEKARGFKLWQFWHSWQLWQFVHRSS